MIQWSREEWKARQTAHLGRVKLLADRFAQRRSHGAKHPVEDFLFTYYNLSPAKLKEWVPPLGVTLEVSEEDWLECPWLASECFVRQNGSVWLDPRRLTGPKRQLADWVRELCQRVLERPARFRCLGLHEWAMVYQQPIEEVRHQGCELRLPASEIASLVESQALCCTHYDAFRFFTPSARPLNAFQPSLETRLEMEQGGCLHTNMDLYKWSSKLLPWCGSDLVGECFVIAWAARQLDMRASPYELRSLGYEPIFIEAAEGRAEYEIIQKAIAADSEPLRRQLHT
ncbi:MAG: hypothetical protein ACKO8Z_17250, partial [Prosthecobacter sp.]